MKCTGKKVEDDEREEVCGDNQRGAHQRAQVAAPSREKGAWDTRRGHDSRTDYLALRACLSFLTCPPHLSETDSLQQRFTPRELHRHNELRTVASLDVVQQGAAVQAAEKAIVRSRR